MRTGACRRRDLRRHRVFSRPAYTRDRHPRRPRSASPPDHRLVLGQTVVLTVVGGVLGTAGAAAVNSISRGNALRCDATRSFNVYRHLGRPGVYCGGGSRDPSASGGANRSDTGDTMRIAPLARCRTRCERDPDVATSVRCDPMSLISWSAWAYAEQTVPQPVSAASGSLADTSTRRRRSPYRASCTVWPGRPNLRTFSLPLALTTGAQECGRYAGR